jgi:hypothetical protein
LLYKLLLSSKHTIMSSFYEDASLVMIPSGYKTSKVYSAKPTDGAGDLTFSRSNDTATRVNSAGLIEKVRTNLILQSNSFSDAAWVKLGAGTGTAPVLTANYTTDPFGGNNAWRFQCDLNGGTASGDRSWIYQTFAGSPSNGTLSIYVKLNSAGSVNLVFSDGAGDTQTVTSTTWVRLNIPSAAIGEFRLGLIGYNGTDTCDLSIAFSQVEAGDIATDYIPTTTAAVSVGPVANLPRLDYSGGATCPKLLLEPQRTNAIIYSEQFNLWSSAGAAVSSVVANYSSSPEGIQNATQVNFILQGDSDLGVYRTHSITASSTYAYSIYIKGEGSNIGKVVKVKAKRNSGDAASTIITPTLTGEWQRVNFSVTYNANNTSATFYLSSDDATSCLFYGAMGEQGSYITSYIPTLGASVTRGEDIAKTASGVTSIFNSTWTAFGELVIPAQGSPGVATGFGLKSVYGSDNIANWVLGVAHSISSASSVDFVFYVSGVSVKTVTQAITYGTPFKFAVTSDGVVYVNGVQVSASSSLTPATPVEFGFGRLGQTNFSNGEAERVAQALLFKSILPPADLAALTA